MPMYKYAIPSYNLESILYKKRTRSCYRSVQHFIVFPGYKVNNMQIIIVLLLGTQENIIKLPSHGSGQDVDCEEAGHG